jgi:hypothetical protein
MLLSVDRYWNNRMGTDDAKGVRTYSERYRCISNDVNESQLTVLADVRLPRRLARKFDDDAARAVKRNAVQTDAPYVWDATIDYSTEIDGKLIDPATGEPKPFENPLDDPPSYEWDTEDVPCVREYDARGNLYLMSSMEKPDPAKEDVETVLSYRIERNELYYDGRPSIAILYKGTVNKTTFRGFEKWAVKCKRISWKELYRNGIWYSRVTYEFLVKYALKVLPRLGVDVSKWSIIEKWMPEYVLDQGFYEIVPPNNPPQVLMLDRRGQPLSAPVPLDGKGRRLDVTAVPFLPFYHERYPFPEADFAELNL